MATKMLGRKKKIDWKSKEHFLSLFVKLFTLFIYHRFYSKNQFHSSSNKFNGEQVEATVRFQRRFALFLWIVLILFGSYCFIVYIQVKFYVLIICLFHLIMEIFAGGIIDFVCELDAKQRITRKQD